MIEREELERKLGKPKGYLKGWGDVRLIGLERKLEEKGGDWERLKEVTEEEWLKCRNFGKKTLQLIRDEGWCATPLTEEQKELLDKHEKLMWKFRKTKKQLRAIRERLRQIVNRQEG